MAPPGGGLCESPAVCPTSAGGLSNPALVGDIGRRLLESLDTGTRTTILAIILTVAVTAIVVAAETQRYAGAPDGERRNWILPVVAGLSVGIASLVAQRRLVIVVG